MPDFCRFPLIPCVSLRLVWEICFSVIVFIKNYAFKLFQSGLISFLRTYERVLNDRTC